MELPPRPEPPPRGVPPDVFEEEVVVEPAPPRREIWPWLLAFLILVLTGLVVLWLVSRDEDDSRDAAATVVVPSVVGERGPTATARLRSSGFVVRSRREPSQRPEGVVVAQTPQGQARVTRGAVVTLTLSGGARTVGVPKVTGATFVVAVRLLRAGGFGARQERVFASAPAGTVVSQVPPAGAEAEPGTEVTVRVSRGSRTTSVPNVVGQSADEARAALEEAGLTATVQDVPSPQPPGTVVAQSPRAGSNATRGSSVRLNVAREGAGGTTTPTAEEPGTTAPATSAVPNVVGQNQVTAQRRLRAAGFVPRTTYVASTQPAGTVIRQRPSSGRAQQGAEVRIDVSRGANAPASRPVPDVVGVDEATAIAELRQAGFEVQVVDEPTDDPNADGVVLDQDPAGDTPAPPGTQVVLVVGRLSG